MEYNHIFEFQMSRDYGERGREQILDKKDVVVDDDGGKRERDL